MERAGRTGNSGQQHPAGEATRIAECSACRMRRERRLERRPAQRSARLSFRSRPPVVQGDRRLELFDAGAGGHRQEGLRGRKEPTYRPNRFFQGGRVALKRLPETGARGSRQPIPRAPFSSTLETRTNGQAVFESPSWDFRAFDFDRDVQFGDAKAGSVLNATNPDLRSFRAAGGKLLHTMAGATRRSLH